MTTIEVLVDEAGRTRLVGQAHFTRTRGQVSTTFLYDPGYLAGDGTALDPALPLVSGAQHQSGLVRAFADSAPDRWGRGLVEKAERARAREESRSPRHLDDLDFLLGVSDDTRQGALRFRLPGHEDFLGKASSVPRLVSLPELLHASDELASDEDPSAALKQLLDTGTTGLGGARPKASVRLEDGSLAIAKFPHGSDRWDVMAWEATALDLMERAGIRTPQRRLTRVGERSVLILRRFDRTSTGDRIGYISAMTATGSVDGQHRDYADVAEAMRDLSRSPRQDHQELFDRVIASVALGNTDDHLRNHGFLADQGSWTLSPVFDVNPTPDPWRARSTSIMGADAPPDEVDGLLALAEDCGLTTVRARERMGRVAGALTGWREQARGNRIGEREITMMAESIEPRLEAVSAGARTTL
ncbi:HipA domain protein [Xylanimonas cellulosilytica DSM 15894]|uniref:HipA domain protein n=1 Tax=Xylanimonas cellulosilytica (strain DSM 15894 / JCM 12276 / CECT 5975 / KCTC 9989 / LMG 20990 / NBRC 107835 / XIL07) TaxID=446471 RepID=D1BYQ5_XYLCX|nr:type II toxin-antitoxin system HipA family toxin [Xylanimonas cellulosilytica]ACZ29980.1 HipA domain protein [Xylanimonas cellulosilytica DSM 15894]